MKIILNIACLVLVFTVPVFSLMQPQGGEIAVIVNKGNPITSLSVSEIKLYYLRKLKKRWPGINKNIRPVDRKNKCSEQDSFYSQILGMSSTEVETYFMNKQLQNAERPQDKFSSDSEVINFVGQEPGAIGFINVRSLTAEVKEKIKVVNIL